MSNYGRETITLVQIDQPLCSHEWGDALFSPSGGCPAVLGTDGDRKCFNTRATCPVPNSYSPGTLTLTFSRPQDGISKTYGFAIPSIESISTTPGAINLAGMDESASPLGQREVVNITFADHLYSDLLVDKYRLERQSGEAAFGSPPETYTPYARGTFWGKWLARNPYHQGYPLRVYEGYKGDALSAMRVRHYVIDRIDNPDDSGTVKLVAKDLFAKIEDEKAVAPKASKGSLVGALTAGGASFSVDPAGIGDEDYFASGVVRIGEELIRYTRSGDTFTVVERGAFNTVAAAHEDEDLVQQALWFNGMAPHDITWTLLCDYTSLGNGGSPTGSDHINKSEWDERASDITEVFTGVIAEPTPVGELCGELSVQASFTIWPDLSTNMIKFAALRAGSLQPVVDDRDWIISGSLTTKREIEKRASQVWVYYGQIDPTKDKDDRINYRSRYVDPDLAAESTQQYGTPRIREIFSRWIAQGGRTTAANLADRIQSMFRDPPLRVEFSVHNSRSGELAIAEYFTLRTDRVQDETGADVDVSMAVVKLAHGENEIDVQAQELGTFTESDGIREIFIETDSLNLNMRTLHDALYAEPVGGSPGESVYVYNETGVIIGSSSTSTPALTTGEWPAGVFLSFVNAGRVQGKGGNGGAAKNSSTKSTAGQAGNDGGDGGPALEALYAVTVDNTNGEIWGGGGGGAGGGGAIYDHEGSLSDPRAGGGAGGGGAGTNVGSGGGQATWGGADAYTTDVSNGSTATAGTATNNGSRGTGAQVTITASLDDSGKDMIGGRGGHGGDPGQPGESAVAGSRSAATVRSSYLGAAGDPGAAGNYIEGNAFVTWVGVGDVRGGVA